jgi:hypothetical protein
VAKTGSGEAEVASEMNESLAADVAQLDVLEVVPDALVGVQVRSVAGELLELDAVGSASSPPSRPRRIHWLTAPAVTPNASAIFC